jgi:hypothetical protein
MLMLQRFSQDHPKVMTFVVHVVGIGKDMLCSQMFWMVQERHGAIGYTHNFRNRLCLQIICVDNTIRESKCKYFVFLFLVYADKISVSTVP